MSRSWIGRLLLAVMASGCYHFSFEQRSPPPGARLVVFKERPATHVNGFVGTGTVDVRKYCAEPIRTELRVTATDVLLSMATLLIYTPHTLYVTCAEPAPGASDDHPGVVLRPSPVTSARPGAGR
jgi:hypothetical protein